MEAVGFGRGRERSGRLEEGDGPTGGTHVGRAVSARAVRGRAWLPGLGRAAGPRGKEGRETWAGEGREERRDWAGQEGGEMEEGRRGTGRGLRKRAEGERGRLWAGLGPKEEGGFILGFLFNKL